MFWLVILRKHKTRLTAGAVSAAAEAPQHPTAGDNVTYRQLTGEAGSREPSGVQGRVSYLLVISFSLYSNVSLAIRTGLFAKQ